VKKIIRFLSITMFLTGATMASLSGHAKADTCWSGNSISCGKDGMCCSATASSCTVYKCIQAV
jgi:hypothetical protein